MKKLTTLILSLICILGLAGCGSRPENTANVIEGNIRTYSEMPDGTWQAEGKTYKYRLEISGRMPNAVADTTFIYLSNIEDITFEQAWKAAGISSNMADYFSADDAVLVEIKTE